MKAEQKEMVRDAVPLGLLSGGKFPVVLKFTEEITLFDKSARAQSRPIKVKALAIP